MNLDFCKYVDVFYGNGETDRFFEDGLASKWFYIKALCGNTHPHATLPFGKMSVGAYSGGYPTGYGTHYPNSCGGIKKLGDVHKVKGFSHIHHSGTGGIKYYYNYAIVTPFYGDDVSIITEGRAIKDEVAYPGYYKAMLDDILCELTVDGGVAIHRYTFGREGGRIAIDFSNDGLDEKFGDRFFANVKDPKTEIVSDREILFSGEFSGIKIWFCVKAECEDAEAHLFKLDGSLPSSGKSLPFGATVDFNGKSLLLRVGYSTVSSDKARADVRASTVSFDGAKESAYNIWNKHLSAFKIQSEDDELIGKFYSCLYHSIIKPCDMTGESILGVSDDVVSDFATFWDQYKTAIPLLLACYPDMGKKIVRGVRNISKILGKIPCSFGLTDIFSCEEQAKMLGIYSLCDAYHFGYEDASAEVIEECIERELQRKDYISFLKNGYFDRYTHILDVTDACLDVASITENPALKDKLLKLAENWKGAYSDEGLMSENSPYYEGDRYTYSFRIQKNMDTRVEAAGGKEKFSDMLDSFFGFGKDSVKQLTYLGADKEISRCNYHRFEGFNNECDMETPYAYIYADRHDRLCEIVHECVNRSFGVGRSGLPGNNDSGGLTSLFIWNAIGIFPVSGSGEFLIGSPSIDKADILLASGNTLTVTVNRTNKEQIYVDRIVFNGNDIKDYRISMRDAMNGGVLEFYMK